MSAEAKIEALRAQHQSLESDLEEELNHPSPDEAKVAELKKEKLRSVGNDSR